MRKDEEKDEERSLIVAAGSRLLHMRGGTHTHTYTHIHTHTWPLSCYVLTCDLCVQGFVKAGAGAGDALKTSLAPSVASSSPSASFGSYLLSFSLSLALSLSLSLALALARSRSDSVNVSLSLSLSLSFFLSSALKDDDDRARNECMIEDGMNDRGRNECMHAMQGVGPKHLGQRRQK